MRANKNEDFREVSYDEAIDEAAKIFVGSKRPLLYGWASASCEVHEKGILLAEELGAIIDNTSSALPDLRFTRKACQVPHLDR